MIVPRGSIACSGQSGGCSLESRIVGDRKPPVGGQLASLGKLQGPDPKGPKDSRFLQDLLCAEPANCFEANFVSSFSVPNTKSLFSFITLRKK